MGKSMDGRAEIMGDGRSTRKGKAGKLCCAGKCEGGQGQQEP